MGIGVWEGYYMQMCNRGWGCHWGVAGGAGGGGGGACDQQHMTSVGVSRGQYVTGRMVMVAGAAGQGNKGIRLH